MINETESLQKTEEQIPEQDNPYAYLDRNFSSENFKIEIKNLPKFYGIGELKKLLNNKLKLNSNKIKTPRKNSPYAFVCFRNEDDRDKAIIVLNECKWKGNQLQATFAKPSADPLVKKRKENSDKFNVKKMKMEKLTVEERIKLSTIPLADVPYETQLQSKQDKVRNLLKQLANDIGNQNIEIREYLDKQKQKFDGLPCQLLDIQYSTNIDGYRNKCEFSIGINSETQQPTVGFRIGAYVNGIIEIGPVEHLHHIPKAMKVVVKVFENFVRSSKLKVYNAELQTGHFKQLTVRTATNQVMVVVGIDPQKLTDNEIKEFKQELVDFFTKGAGKDANVTSLYYEALVKRNPGESALPSSYLFGETHIYETILDKKFRISPEAFFQINTEAAEILYKTAINLAEPSKNSTMVDVCCGTGTIGLCFAEHCGQVLGLELVPQAIIDAKENAILNKIENSEFFTGKAEEILGSVCYNSKHEDIFAVVDPPRAGLHQKAIHQLRKIKKINRLIYISCNPKLAMKNFIDLSRPESKYLHGQCFVPVKAVAVDLFPYTDHYELVICYKRWNLVKSDSNV
ncbi:hypothetical protein ABEB36_008361 [Hypothenemus hampei]|uniref:tRNA (uracil(54)-C(5))-methyltransferase n=1 Tax=Hypothenemus hampei TaxID=57062 RepID=A0ABD1ELK4_HYPHA